MPRNKKMPPRDHLPSGDWPHGKLPEDAPSEARQAQTLARRLRKLVKDADRSIYAIARDAGLTPQTIHNVLQGRNWPDLVTIHRLEVELGEKLWVNADLPWGVEDTRPHHFHRRNGAASMMGFVEAGDWQMEVRPADRIVDWRWSISRLTDEGWTVDDEGAAADPESAEHYAEQRIADRIAAAPSAPDERSERQRP